MTRAAAVRLAVAGTLVVFLVVGWTFTGRSDAEDPAYAKVRHFGEPAGLPRPSSMTVPQFEEKLFTFLN